MQKLPDSERRSWPVMIRLNKRERAALHALAKRTGEREAELVRRLLREEAAKC